MDLPIFTDLIKIIETIVSKDTTIKLHSVEYMGVKIKCVEIGRNKKEKEKFDETLTK